MTESLEQHNRRRVPVFCATFFVPMSYSISIASQRALPYLCSLNRATMSRVRRVRNCSHNPTRLTKKATKPKAIAMTFSVGNLVLVVDAIINGTLLQEEKVGMNNFTMLEIFGRGGSVLQLMQHEFGSQSRNMMYLNVLPPFCEPQKRRRGNLASPQFWISHVSTSRNRG